MYNYPVPLTELYASPLLSDFLSDTFSDGPDTMAVTVNGQNMTSFSTGSNLTMLCSAQSNPPAHLQWAFRGELVNTTGPLLELFSVSVDQSGPYSCLAFNNHTNMNSNITTHIMVESECDIIMILPSIFLNLLPTSPLFWFVSTELLSGSEQQAINVWLLPLLLLVRFFY